ncbi:hypothetical protein Tco_1247874 [Tanacetum coccineum]
MVDGNSSIDAPNLNSFNDHPNDFTHPPQPQYESYLCELCGNDAHYGYDCPPRMPLATNLSTHTPEPSRRFNFIYDDDDDDEESTIPLNKNISQLPPSIAITTVLLTMEPEDSLIMGDEDLGTIPEKESDEVIKSSVEDLVPIPIGFAFTPLSDANEDECFNPGGEIDEIDAFLDMDISMDFEDDYYDSEGDIIYLKSLLIKDTIPNLPP